VDVYVTNTVYHTANTCTREQEENVRLLKRTCTRAFRVRVMELFPALEGSEKLVRLMAHFIWGRRTPAGGVVVDRELLMKCAGTKNHSFNGGKLLRDFCEQVCPLVFNEELNTKTGELMEWSWQQGKAREVFILWPAEMLELIAKEHEVRVQERMQVYFVSGLVFNRKRRAETVKEAVVEAERTPAHCDQAKQLLAYLNGAPSNRYAFIENNIALVEGRIRVELKDQTQAQQLGILQNIAETLKPVYEPKENTVRLYETTGGFTFIKSEYRLLLAPQWVEYDLEASQLRIAAYRWGCQPLIEMFERGQKPWPVLLLGLGLTAEMKPLVKNFTYGVQYTAGREGLLEVALDAAKKDVDGDDILFEATAAKYTALVDKFLELPLIKALKEARDRMIEVIKAKRKRGEDIYTDLGTTIAKDVEPHKALVRMNQATELRIAFAGAQIAIEEDILVAWQHDGWSVNYTQPHRSAAIERRMMQAVETEGLKLGIPSKLERKGSAVSEMRKAA
jgi:hypothetical protein